MPLTNALFSLEMSEALGRSADRLLSVLFYF